MKHKRTKFGQATTGRLLAVADVLCSWQCCFGYPPAACLPWAARQRLETECR